MKNLIKSNLSIVSFYSTNSNNIGNTKHYPPAIKEWKDSVYSYNKNYLKSLVINKKITNDFITSHFNLSNLKNIARSKRMRNLIMKKSSKKIFVSKPYVKHNNDKLIVNLYVYNRQKEFIMRKLYFYKRKYSLFKHRLNNSNIKKIIIKKKLKNRLFYINRKRKDLFNKKTIKHLPFYGTKYKNELDYVKYRTSNMFKKFLYFNNLFIYFFLQKLLYLFNINLFIPIWSNILSKKIYNKKFLKKMLIKKPKIIMWYNKNSKQLNYIDKKYLNEKLINKIIFNYRYNFNDLFIINKHLLYYIINTGKINNLDLINMYVKFKNKYYDIFVFKFFRNKLRILFYIKALILNNIKFSKLLYNLKIYIYRIYNKKVELNITNLKSPFLNTDVYNKIIINKAVKKIKFLNVLRSSLTLLKRPREILLTKTKNLKLNDYKSINNYNTLLLNNIFTKDNKNQLNESKDHLNNIFINIYPHHFVNKKSTNNKSDKENLNKITSILNTIKFKWVSGLKLQGAGRLTRRYTAERSVLKIRQRGSLKSKQFFFKNDSFKLMPTVMIRNIEKPNSQYTFMKSKRRIGSFGIKSWISSY